MDDLNKAAENTAISMLQEKASSHVDQTLSVTLSAIFSKLDKKRNISLIKEWWEGGGGNFPLARSWLLKLQTRLMFHHMIWYCRHDGDSKWKDYCWTFDRGLRSFCEILLNAHSISKKLWKFKTYEWRQRRTENICLWQADLGKRSWTRILHFIILEPAEME